MIQRINKTKLVKMAGVSRNTFDKRYMAWVMQNEPPMYQNERIIEWTADAANRILDAIASFLNHLCDGELENFLTKSPDINYIRFNSVKTLRFKVLFISS